MELSVEQREELMRVVEAGPQAAGFESGVWTGPMVGQSIRERFDVSYHNHWIPPLLHQLGFSLQRPRKRLCRADAEKQREWVEGRVSAIKKAAACRGMLWSDTCDRQFTSIQDADARSTDARRSPSVGSGMQGRDGPADPSGAAGTDSRDDGPVFGLPFPDLCRRYAPPA